MNRYAHLTAPIKVGSTVLKSRFFYPVALPHFQQGPENYPADPMISFHANLARNGAAMIHYHHMDFKYQRQSLNVDGRHMPMMDTEDFGVQNYICQLNDNIRYYGGCAIYTMFEELMHVFAVQDEPANPGLLDHVIHQFPQEVRDNLEENMWLMKVFGMAGKKGMTAGDIEESIRNAVKKGELMKSLGFAGGSINISGGSVFGSFLAEALNRRDDEYGGSMENRMRYPLEALSRLKKALGKDFMIVLDYQTRIAPPDMEGPCNMTRRELVTFLKAAEPYFDLLVDRSGIIHTGFDGKPEQYAHPLAVEEAAELKAAGLKVPVAAWSGFQDPALMEQVLAQGKCDMIVCSRLFIANPDLGELIARQKGEDVVPCIHCNRCHGVSLEGDWVSACSVNPELGLVSRVDRMVKQPERIKKVAVVGGGPAGMRAALYAARRGHDVTLFEVSGELGGQLIGTKYPSFKWHVKRYVDYLVGQMEKTPNIRLRLNTRATPALIAEEAFDAVLAALGAVITRPPIDGADKVLWNPINVLGNEDKLGGHVVCIGGSESVVEAAFYLREHSHRVTVLSRKDSCAYDATPIHYLEYIKKWFRTDPDISFVPNATTTKIETGRVHYMDAEGVERVIDCDDVVATGGMVPLQEEAMGFYGSAPEFYMIGDCRKVGNIRHCTREAFAAASQI